MSTKLCVLSRSAKQYRRRKPQSNFLSFNPHVHILAADGCFSDDGFFYVPSINIDTGSIEKLFIHKIFKLLLKKGLITERVVELISSWRHTGFSTYLRKEDKS
jgi:hypothetical protein